MLSGSDLCDELITRPEESYRLWRAVVYDLETSKEEAKSPLKGCEYKPTMGCDAERRRRRRRRKYCTCFGQVHCPSSGVSQQCIHKIVICHASSVGCLLAWS